MATLAPSLRRLDDETRVRWATKVKLRRSAKEGWVGDAAHASRPSGHNADKRGVVHAKDFDVLGLNVQEFLGRVIGDPRVWYVVYAGTIWNRRNDWQPEKYNGSNPHTDHVHVSLINSTEGRKWSAKELAYAESTTTGWGLASLVRPRSVQRFVARIRRRGY